MDLRTVSIFYEVPFIMATKKRYEEVIVLSAQGLKRVLMFAALLR